MAIKTELHKGLEDTMSELERLADEVRLKLHLAGMDARDAWDKTLEPKLVDARRHAKEASTASRAAIDDTVKAIRDFAKSL